MKYLTITGGLGNQMFIYAFCLELQKRGQKARLFVPFKHNSKKYGHQGYELEKIFGIHTKSTFLLDFYAQILRFFPKKYREKLYQLIGIYMVKVEKNFIFYPEVFDFKHKNELFRGTWQSEKFFENTKNDVKKAFVFDENLLSEETKKLKNEIENTNSVSIHIRRGDYLSAQYANGFANICTMNYYKKAVEKILVDFRYRENQPLIIRGEKFKENVKFFIFTDDKDWVQENFKLENAAYVTHNSGGNSWQDMYLMSRCKHNIVANSSFSWWGAWLNDNAEKMVIAPKRWWQSFENDDVVPENWIRI
ncbi:MAG: alpha-1,2-fucosyltransferase [Prevotellaceae bacterium]|jgi:hypothetical protein|nr:alpha-1,2-fucosyltransferase [Prevotellaceae bacterium]